MRRREWSDPVASALDNMLRRAVADDSLMLTLVLAVMDAGHKLMHSGKLDEACMFFDVAATYLAEEMVEEGQEEALLVLTDRLSEGMLDPQTAEGPHAIAAVRQVHEMLDFISSERGSDDEPTYH